MNLLALSLRKWVRLTEQRVCFFDLLTRKTFLDDSACFSQVTGQLVLIDLVMKCMFLNGLDIILIPFLFLQYKCLCYNKEIEYLVFFMIKNFSCCFEASY